MKVNNLDNVLRYLDFDIDDDLQRVLNEDGLDILSSTKSMANPEVSGTFDMYAYKDGETFIINIGSNDVMAAFSEFGTGGNASSYLSGKPAGMKDHAMSFFVNGLGRMMPTPALFPSFYNTKLLAKVSEMINNRIKQK